MTVAVLRQGAAGLARSILLLSLLFPIGEAAAREFRSYALVNDDGTLQIQGQTFILQGIYIPTTGVGCKFERSPEPCASPSVQALRQRIGSRFVYCLSIYRTEEGAFVGSCLAGRSRGDEEDLGAWMIRNGWALAGPDAPYEFIALERLAERQRLGIWSFPPP